MTANNTNLTAAKRAKQDEFYTQWIDIEREMNAYLDFDPDVFRGKTVLLPCDDPEWSNFTKFFAFHFYDFGLKKLISTSYESKPFGRGRVFVLENQDFNAHEKIDINNLQWSNLEGNGDFHSEEVTALRDEADMVITNPPFSLFREFIAWLMTEKPDGSRVQFSVIGNMNAITYKEVFPLIKDNQLWLGRGKDTGGNSMWFEVPVNAPYNKNEKTTDDGTRLIPVTSKWFTNIEHGRRHEPLGVMTMADNLRYSRHKKILEEGYPTYDNYNAIEVGFTDAIPSDYDGVMGVPISFLDKYCPEQFEIVGATESEGKGFSQGLWNKDSGVAQPMVASNRIYKRIFIRPNKGGNA